MAVVVVVTFVAVANALVLLLLASNEFRDGDAEDSALRQWHSVRSPSSDEGCTSLRVTGHLQYSSKLAGR